MLPIVFKLSRDEILLFEEGNIKGEKKISLEPTFEDQTSLEFCIFQGKNREKIWYRLHEESGLKKTEVKFTYLDRKLDISASNKELTLIKDINGYFRKLWDQKKYWDILGIKEHSDDYDTARNFRVQIIFSDEQEVHGIINSAYQEIKKVKENFGLIKVELDLSSLYVYLDSNFEGKFPCTIRTEPGEHIIVLKKDGNKIGTYKVTINKRERKNVIVPVSTEMQVQELKKENNRKAEKLTLVETQLQKLKDENNRKAEKLTLVETQLQELKDENNRKAEKLTLVETQLQELKNENNSLSKQIYKEKIIEEFESGRHRMSNVHAVSNITLSLLVILTIMSAIDILSPQPFLFIFYFVSFFGVFYNRRKLGSGLAIFSGFLSLLKGYPIDPLFLFLGVILLILGIKKYVTTHDLESIQPL
jgi:hypothetical protein